MKRILLGLSSVLIAPLLLTSFTVAISENTPTDVKTAHSAATENDAPVVEPSAAEKAKALAERVEKRKTDIKTKLSNAEKARIKTKCKASQGLVSSIEGRIKGEGPKKGIETDRTEKYANLIKHLTGLSTKLKNNNLDTTALDESITVLHTKVDTFESDLATYKQLVNDLVGIDCAADPDGFKASLEAARAGQAKVGDDSKAIKAHVNDVIKPLLKAIRSQLDTKPESSTAKPVGGQ